MLLALTHEQFVDLEPTLRAAYRRGVSVHVAMHCPEEEMPRPEEFAGSCTEVRWGETPCLCEPFLALVDGETVNFVPFSRETPWPHRTALDDETTPPYGVVINDPIHAYVFEWYFLSALWDPSTVLYSERDGDPPFTFVDVRELIQDGRPAPARGKRRDGDRRGSIGQDRPQSDRRGTNRHRAVGYPGPVRRHLHPVSILTREATVVLETDDGTVTVGREGRVRRRRRGRTRDRHRNPTDRKTVAVRRGGPFTPVPAATATSATNHHPLLSSRRRVRSRSV